MLYFQTSGEAPKAKFLTKIKFRRKKTKKSKNKKRHAITFQETEPLEKTKKDSIKNPARTIH